MSETFLQFLGQVKYTDPQQGFEVHGDKPGAEPGFQIVGEYLPVDVAERFQLPRPIKVRSEGRQPVRIDSPLLTENPRLDPITGKELVQDLDVPAEHYCLVQMEVSIVD